LNLVPRRINLNFWYGQLLAAGWEQMLLDGKHSRAKIEKVMNKKHREYLSKYTATPEDKDEMELQRELISLFLAGAAKQDFFKDMRITESQKVVSWPIADTGITFYGTLDGLGTYKGVSATFENKTASQITDNTLSALAFDWQAYGYPIGLKKLGQRFPTKCCYCIFRKTQKRVKKGQTEEDFIEEIREDITKRPKFYYVHQPLNLGRQTIRAVQTDIEAGAAILAGRYKQLSTKQLLNPDNWPKQPKQCLSYGTCPYFMLCRHPLKWKVYVRLFQQREMLYEAEKGELQK